MQDAAARIAKAEGLENEQRWKDALASWRRLAAETRDLRFVIRAAIAAENADMTVEAERLYRDAIAAAPKESHAYFGLGLLLKKRGRFEAAREVLQIGVALEEQPLVLAILGAIQRHLGDPAAEATLRRSLELDPANDEAHISLARALDGDKPLEAIEHLRRALEIAPDAHDVRRELGELLWRLKKFDEAAVVLKQAVGEDSTDAWSHEYLGYIYEQQEDWIAAKAAFLRATQLQPGIGTFWRFLADACAMLDERETAERHYLKALSLGVDDAITNARYGLLLKRSGHFRRARAYLQRAVDLDPAQAKAREALEHLRHGGKKDTE